MPRDERAYLEDILESCDAILVALRGVDVEAYKSNRLVRSSVEREFTIIGEAVNCLSRNAPELFASITHARHVVDFRNQLAHEYSNVNDTFVWGIADREVPVLRRECAQLLTQLESSGSAD